LHTGRNDSNPGHDWLDPNELIQGNLTYLYDEAIDNHGLDPEAVPLVHSVFQE
jgi:hypothetical protein